MKVTLFFAGQSPVAQNPRFFKCIIKDENQNGTFDLEDGKKSAECIRKTGAPTPLQIAKDIASFGGPIILFGEYHNINLLGEYHNSSAYEAVLETAGELAARNRKSIIAYELPGFPFKEAMRKFYAGKTDASKFKEEFLKAADESNYRIGGGYLLPQANFIVDAWKAGTRVVLIDDSRPEDKEQPFDKNDLKIKQARDKTMAKNISDLATAYPGFAVLALGGADHTRKRDPETGIGKYLIENHKYGDQDILSLNFTPYVEGARNYRRALSMVLTPHNYYNSHDEGIPFSSLHWGKKFDTWDYFIPWAVK
jgi:hypothetical protein